MKRFISTFSLLVMLLILSQCDPTIQERVPESGTADFSSYVAIGNSLTAGYADNALYREGQLNSFPNILAGQMQQAGGGAFEQPLVEPGPGSNADGEARLILQLVPGSGGSMTLVPGPAVSEGQDIFSDDLDGPFHNMGVPGVRSYHVPATGLGNAQAGPGNYNPFFTRFMSEPGTSILQDALLVEPTFFTLWIGSNDVLAYATSGGDGNPNGGMGKRDITPSAVFDNSFDAILNTLTGAGADGVVINIPDITNIPFFTTIPWNGLQLTADQAEALRQAYAAQYDAQGVPESFVPDFQEGANGFIIEDPDYLTGHRMAVEGEFVLLSVPQQNLQPTAAGGSGWGSEAPIPDGYTLREPQVESIQTAVVQFNQKLETAADAAGLAYLDMNATLEVAANQGMVFDALLLTTEFVQGGLFSLDGIHLTDRGSAVVANKAMEAINDKYGATLSPVNISAYLGVQFP